MIAVRRELPLSGPSRPVASLDELGPSQAFAPIAPQVAVDGVIIFISAYERVATLVGGRGRRMSKPKGLALIAAGYVLSVGGGLAAVAVNELFMPADVAQTSPGMVAFGDMILFVLVAGFLSLAPTWFLLKLLVEKAPRALLGTELLIAAMGPVSWLAMTTLAVTTPRAAPAASRTGLRPRGNCSACSSPSAPFHAWSLARSCW